MERKLAFLVAAYGESPHLRACIESLKAQSVACEVLLSTSTPNAHIEACAQEFGLSLEINAERRAGIGGDWNFALSRVTRGLAVICHQDDLYEPEFAERMLSLWDEHPDLNAAFCNHFEMVGEAREDWRLNIAIKRLMFASGFAWRSAAPGRSVSRRLLGFGNPVCCPGVVFNRDRLCDFEFSRDWQINLDWEAWLRICQMPGQVGYVRERLVGHRVHAGSETSASLIDGRREAEDRKMFEALWPSWFARVLMLPYRISYRSNS